METTIYHYALCVSLTLMIFFAGRFIFGKLPDRDSYRPYHISRCLMGAALLVLSANYMVHFFVTPRLTSPTNAILMNLCTYWIAVWLFGSALMMLLDKRYVTRRRFARYVAGGGIYTAAALLLRKTLPDAISSTLLPVVLAVVFLVYATRVARKVFVTFRRTAKALDNYYSDDAVAYIRWMSIFTYWAVGFGVGQGVFTFVPDRYVYVWIISAIPFYIYLYVSYANYLLLYEHVETALDDDNPAEGYPCAEEQACIHGSGENTDGKEQPAGDSPRLQSPSGMSKSQELLIDNEISEWIEKKGFATGGLNITDVAREIGTNRTYLSSFIASRYGVTFREWINGLRLDYAKELMPSAPDMPMGEVARRAGYLSLSYFTKTFREAEGVTPGRWSKR